MTQGTDFSKKLASFRIFEGVNASELEVLSPVFSERIFKGGEHLTQFDKMEKEIYFIVCGKVQVTVPNANGQRNEFICDLTENDTVGEFLLARTARRSASCVAFSEVTALITDGEQLSLFLQSHPEIGVKVFRNLSRILVDRLSDNNMLLRRVMGTDSLFL
jgi:CRP-like cAMP-binding protein